jgi:hypothetical protein
MNVKNRIRCSLGLTMIIHSSEGVNCFGKISPSRYLTKTVNSIVLVCYPIHNMYLYWHWSRICNSVVSLECIATIWTYVAQFPISTLMEEHSQTSTIKCKLYCCDVCVLSLNSSDHRDYSNMHILLTSVEMHAQDLTIKYTSFWPVGVCDEINIFGQCPFIYACVWVQLNIRVFVHWKQCTLS